MSFMKEIYRLEFFFFFQLMLSVVSEISFDFKKQASWKNEYIFSESVWEK